MTRRVVPFILTGAILFVGLAVGDEPEPGKGDSGEPPLRLKRKKRAAEPPAQEKDKEKGRQGDKEKEKPKAKDDEAPVGKDKEKAKDDEPPVPEDGRAAEEADEKEILERVQRNMRGVEEKLGNRELGDPTAQQQRDILRDLDSLIKKSEQQSGGGGGQDNQPQQQSGEQEKGKQGGQQQQRMQQQRGSKGQMAQRGGQRPRRELRSERGGRQRDRRMAGNQAPQAPQPQPGQGNHPGAGGQSPPSGRDINTEKYNDFWGHLPESLRAEMNAYSNPQPFMPRYDRLIREYYKTIAEQGRKKGD
jgi:hypothetical protein